MRQFSLFSLLWVTEKRTDFWVLKILPNSNTTVFSTRNCEWKCFQPESTIDVCLAWRVLGFGKDLMEAYKWKKQKWIIIINFGKFTSLWWVLTTHVMENPGKHLMRDHANLGEAFPSPPQAHATAAKSIRSFGIWLSFHHFLESSKRRVDAFPSLSLPFCVYNTKYFYFQCIYWEKCLPTVIAYVHLPWSVSPHGKVVLLHGKMSPTPRNKCVFS